MDRIGRLIAFEGGEGSGKSTQAKLLATHLGADLTREPGGTQLGERLRTLLLDTELEDLDARAEVLVMVAARAQHVAERIRPALVSGRDVVCDRFSGSTLAYQGFGRGLVLAEIERLCAFATGDLWPDLTILLDVAPDLAAQRRGKARDRIEGEDQDFHERVVNGFRELALSRADTWVVVDGSAPVSEIAATIEALVDERLAKSDARESRA